MTKEEIIALAEDCGFFSEQGYAFHCTEKDIDRFAQMIALRERQECANICKKYSDRYKEELEGVTSKNTITRLNNLFGVLNWASKLIEQRTSL